ncbi:MAG: hypothetical protein A2Z96_00645 [Spirochaetes bacterium GWB1_48_6]|nr:MAG: hypothetical protein A2Z96_00645 [Spirochaetes bacterium GWB1_48_6]
MNPKEESYTPGEHHFYSTREVCSPVTPKKGGLGVWFKNNKALALSMGNLFLMVPIVFFLYPFLLHQADLDNQKILGPLTINLQELPEGGNRPFLVTLGFQENIKASPGHFSLDLSFGTQTKHISLYLDPLDGPPKGINFTLEKEGGGKSLKVKAVWNQEFLEWEQALYSKSVN